MVARGLTQVDGIDFNKTFAPVAKLPSLWILLAIAENVKVHPLDVKTAFLNGDLKEGVCMHQPSGFLVKGKENLVCLFSRRESMG